MRVNNKSLSYYVLTVLEKSVDTYIRFEDFTYKTHLYAYGNRWAQELPKSSLSKALNRLKKRLLIEGVKVDGQLIYKLTNTGRELIETGREDEANWDGKWRIVVFDIPETKRIVRNLFRRNLKKWGFKHLQKSVWISRRDVYDKLKRYIEELGLDPWVVIIETNKVTRTI